MESKNSTDGRALPRLPVLRFTVPAHKKTVLEKNGLFCGEVAERTGLEPATSGVTGRRSNQLSYRSTTPILGAGD